jgi:phosphatidylglycerol---prolipoprotein diacylglyceryl transferase
MLPVIRIGPLAVQFPGLILLIGLWVGLELVERQSARHNLPGGKLFSLVLVALGVGIVGARLVYTAQYPDIFNGNLINLFSFSPQLLNLPGGILVCLVAGLAYAKQNRLPLWQTADALTVLLAVIMISIGLSNFASGNAYGAPASVPWAVYLWGQNRHPSQLYETFTAGWVLVIIWPAAKNKFSTCIFSRPGLRFWIFLVLTAASRLFLEYFRQSQWVFDDYRLSQWMAWLILTFGLWNINHLLAQNKTSAQEMDSIS